MSETQMDFVWGSTLRRRAKFVALALAWYAGDEGWCAVSLRRLGRLTGYSERYVQAAISELLEVGYIDVSEPPTRLLTPTFWLHPERLPREGDTMPPPSRESQPARGER